ncbi:MAG: hypothetical protein EB141_05200 [Verrucomicrobia bacterium]|nr:hypothetical protein [Verrucomicrobiota bacterium]NBU08502.1 hypothetical protein [Pseudomonadota bacterium]NDA66050.1 hypothetical protein [Verrucomicrobiota bacterium]NDB75033.1 hypothetical protein [Verrucomicrobiota bacterium]NDD37869.1 hypothetical protein [Verrucomicrobiota bacterium]
MIDNANTSATPPRWLGAERLHALDNLRGVAMTLGISLHAAISLMTVQFPWAARDVSAHWSFDLLCIVIHGFRMQLFFFLAGFFARLLHQRLGSVGFLKQRAVRIGVPFLAGMVLLLPLIGLVWWWGNQSEAKAQLLPAAGPAPGISAIPTAHLWFLEYLLILYVIAALGVCFSRWLPAGLWPRVDEAFDRLMQSPLRALALVPPIVWCLWNGPAIGEVENAGFSIVPSLQALGLYGCFFTVGWWLHRRRDSLSELTQYLKSGFALAGVALVIHLGVLVSAPNSAQSNYLTLKLLGLTCAALYATQMTFTVTGFFLRFASQHQPRARYLADASYWCYLMHLPLVAALQVLVAQWPVNGWLKFIGINAVTLAILLATYQTLVRYTWIGRILNGSRHRPLRPSVA